MYRFNFYIYRESPDKVYVIKKNTIEKYESGTVHAIHSNHYESGEKIRHDKLVTHSGKKLVRNGSDNSLMTNNDNTSSLPREGDTCRFMSSALPKKGKNLLLDLPSDNMQLICHMLSITDMCNVACANKQMMQRVKSQSDIWRIKVYKRFNVKMGYEYVRKENLMRIDANLKPLHKEAMNELLRGKWQQKGLIIIWFLFFFSMALVLFPILLILDEEGVDIPTPVLFLPLTISWIALIVAT
jgi:hypothetical protein